jgi:hypothetical protein
MKTLRKVRRWIAIAEAYVARSVGASLVLLLVTEVASLGWVYAWKGDGWIDTLQLDMARWLATAAVVAVHYLTRGIANAMRDLSVGESEVHVRRGFRHHRYPLGQVADASVELSLKPVRRWLELRDRTGTVIDTYRLVTHRDATAAQKVLAAIRANTHPVGGASC